MWILFTPLTGTRRTQEVWTTCSWDGGRRSSAEVADLKHQPHGGVQGYPLVTGQCQHLGEGKQQLVHPGAPSSSSWPLGSLLCHLLPSALLNFLSITGTQCHFLSHQRSTNSLLLCQRWVKHTLNYSGQNTQSANKMIVSSYSLWGWIIKI